MSILRFLFSFLWFRNCRSVSVVNVLKEKQFEECTIEMFLRFKLYYDKCEESSFLTSGISIRTRGRDGQAIGRKSRTSQRQSGRN